MRLWAICGYDNIFEGSYGMKEAKIYKGTKDEAISEARELSEDVINSYPDIHNALEELVRECCEDDGIEIGTGSELEENIREDLYEGDITYDCIELDVNKLPTLNIKELERMYYNNDNFIKTYKLN